MLVLVDILPFSVHNQLSVSMSPLSAWWPDLGRVDTAAAHSLHTASLWSRFNTQYFYILIFLGKFWRPSTFNLQLPPLQW